MENIYCTACSTKITMHADVSFICACEGPIDPLEDPVPDTWEMADGDSDSVYYALCRLACAERFYQEADNATES